MAFVFAEEDGMNGAEGARTPDLLGAIQALSQTELRPQAGGGSDRT